MLPAGGTVAGPSAAQRDTLTDIAQGYFRSRALSAAARLGVADALGESEQSVDRLAASCGAEPGALYRLLRALASFGVVAETSPMRFVLTPFGGPLRKDSADSQWASIVFWSDLLADSWSYLTECVRTGNSALAVRPEGIPSRWSQDPNATAIFRAVMGNAPTETYLPIANAWDFSPYRLVADLGGAGGILIAAILKTFPNVSGMLVDRQEAIDGAAARLAREGLSERCLLRAADLCEDVPAGADVYMLKHVLHGYDDQGGLGILRHCRRVVPPEGRLLLIEFVLPDVVDRPDPALEGRLMSDLNMLAVTGGKERSAVEWKSLLRNAGFECLGIVPVAGDLVSIVEAA
jgi:hypothetical protein